jgi:hypothetical protein
VPDLLPFEKEECVQEFRCVRLQPRALTAHSLRFPQPTAVSVASSAGPPYISVSALFLLIAWLPERLGTSTSCTFFVSEWLATVLWRGTLVRFYIIPLCTMVQSISRGLPPREVFR